MITSIPRLPETKFYFRCPSSHRIQAFNSPYEQINLLLALAFLPVVIGDAYSSFFRTPEADFYLKFLASYIFFNTTHTILTFFCIFTFPEFKTALKQKDPSLKLISRATIVGLCLLSIFTFSVITNFMYLNDPHLLQMALLTYVCLKGIHNIGQIRGVCSIYNKNFSDSIDSDPKLYAKASAFMKRESRLFTFATTCIFIWFPLRFFFPHFLNWRLLTFGLVILVTLLIFLNAILAPDFRNSNKWLFMIRIFFIPLSILSVPAQMVARGLHGVEYLLIVHKMSNKSKSKLNWFGAGLLIWSAMGVWAILRGIRRHNLLPSASPNTLKALGTVLLFVEFSHYYLDAVLFRFKDPVTAKTIGPLLRQ